MIDLSMVKKIHIIGIGGVSNSGIAEIFVSLGYDVTGSDLASSHYTDQLMSKGVKVYNSHRAEHVTGADLVIYTAAVSEDNPELLSAAEHKIPTISRAEALGQLMLNYSQSIAIAGTHGKTTTTSMVTRLLNDAILNPTTLIGGYFEDIKSNIKIGGNDIFITEACEYKESFLSFFPTIAVILNIDEDHLDYYKDLNAITDAFVAFSKNIPEDGLLILNGDDYNSRKLLSHYTGKSITFGLNDACDLKAERIVYDANGAASFQVVFKGAPLMPISLSIPGQHSIYNALAAIAVALQFPLDHTVIQKRMNSFQNAQRRFEKIGLCKGANVVDDYAHHPNEIKATLDAASRMTNVSKITVVFQPHTYSRTKELFNEFTGAFNGADEIVLCDIYAARESDPGDIHSKDLCEALIKEGYNAIYMSDFNAIASYLTDHAKPNDLILTMGAGNVYTIGHKICGKSQ